MRGNAPEIVISDADPLGTNHILKDVISSWDRLKSLEVSDTLLTTSSLAHLAQLPNLEALSAGLSPDIEFSSLNFPLRVFPALRQLRVTCNSVLMVQALLKISPLRALRYLEVITGGHVDCERIIKSFFTLMQTQLSNLLQMSLYNFDAPSAADNHSLNLSTLAPLFSFVGLKVLRIDTPHTFDLGNEDLRIMAESWPNLFLLFLGVHGWGHPSKITPSGLVPLLNRCSKLLCLSLAIDASVVDIKLDEAIFTRPNIRLRYLCLQDSRLENPQVMAAFLSDMISDTTTLIAWGESGKRGLEHISQAEAKVFEKRWKEAALATNLFFHVRKQERLRAKIY
ncbi:hypothetical protein HWV62_20236 [Athelia sp. TMB]|nr:hypothetical protein HWV62_20236 [Athelia sp. TMB]